jgi:hypothetical protein
MYQPQPFVTRLSFRSSDRPEAIEAKERLTARYGDVGDENAQVIVALGGDGFMLETLHEAIASQTPIYGMNRGSVGFLMNEYSEDGLLERINAAERAAIHPLAMVAIDANRKQHRALAINEVSLLRQTRQTAKLRISIDGKVRMGELVCDGARLDGLQPLGPRPDHPDRRPGAGAHPDFGLPPPPLARRPAAAVVAGDLRDPGSRQAPGQRRGRQFRGPRRAGGPHLRGPRHPAVDAFRRRPQSRGKSSGGAVLGLALGPRLRPETLGRRN